MRIAQISPLWERVPPLAYGGIELVISLLTEELVRRGHHVTLFATGDSQTRAHLVSSCTSALRAQSGQRAQDVMVPPDHIIYQQMQLSQAFQRAPEFDVIHSHVDYAALPYADLIETPVVHTLHYTLTPLLAEFFTRHRQQNFVSISNSQRYADLALNYVATVYNAIATDTFTVFPEPEMPPYLAFVGRMSEPKGPHLAIEIAQGSGLPLKLMGKNDPCNRDFFDHAIAPHIDGQQIEFLGEVDHATKNEVMGRALATLFPITWCEPFGLVMIESMASGTPVIAMNRGAASEVIVDGQTGILCDTVEDCIAAVKGIHQLHRPACRTHVEANFSVPHMVDGYEAVYQTLRKDARSLFVVPPSSVTIR